MTLGCGCEGDICQGHSGELLGVTILTEISYKELRALQRVARVAKLYLEHGEPELADDLEEALKELENHWRIGDV